MLAKVLHGSYAILNEPIQQRQISCNYPAVVAEWSKTVISQIQVENTVAEVPGLNPAQDTCACHFWKYIVNVP